MTHADEPDRDEMVEIPAGPFPMGTDEEVTGELADEHGYHPSWFDGETPRREVAVDAFEIDRYPVTNGGYAEFCADTGHEPPMHWEAGEPGDDLLDHPVVHVDRADARAYAEWAGKRLPTEAEWEKAARGADGQQFPWGEAFDPDLCNWNRDPLAEGLATAPVTAHEDGASPYGVVDMVGNAAEWCADAPASEADGSEAAPGPGPAAIKGGAWLTTEVVNLRPAARNMSGFSNNPHEYYGFRCARNR